MFSTSSLFEEAGGERLLVTKPSEDPFMCVHLQFVTTRRQLQHVRYKRVQVTVCRCRMTKTSWMCLFFFFTVLTGRDLG